MLGPGPSRSRGGGVNGGGGTVSIVTEGSSDRIRPMLRMLLSISLAWMVPAPAGAVAGIPPLMWIVPGDTVAELTAAGAVAPDAGMDAGFAGPGRGEDSLAIRRYVMAPVTVRYGMWNFLEAFAIAPFTAAESPQRFINYATGGAPEEYRVTLEGADFGDPAVGVRVRAWRSDDERWAGVGTLGMVFPLGTNIWTNSRYNFVTGSARPDLAVGDGAYALVLAVQGLFDDPGWQCEGMAGYVLRFPVEAAAIEPGASTITIHEPSPVVGWVRASWKMSEDTWLTGRVDGFWAAGGTITTDGLLARHPETLPVVLDSYAHVLRAAGGAWAGVGIHQALGTAWTAELGVLAPLAVHAMYRVVRVTASLGWAWKP